MGKGPSALNPKAQIKTRLAQAAQSKATAHPKASNSTKPRGPGMLESGKSIASRSMSGAKRPSTQKRPSTPMGKGPTAMTPGGPVRDFKAKARATSSPTKPSPYPRDGREFAANPKPSTKMPRPPQAPASQQRIKKVSPGPSRPSTPSSPAGKAAQAIGKGFKSIDGPSSYVQAVGKHAVGQARKNVDNARNAVQGAGRLILRQNPRTTLLRANTTGRNLALGKQWQ